MLVVTAESVRMAVILIVEDDVFIRSDAEAMIQDWNHRTLLASSQRRRRGAFTPAFVSPHRRTLYRYLSQKSGPWRL